MAGRISVGGFPPEAAPQIADTILNEPMDRTITAIQNLLGERIRLCSRNERGKPDQAAVALWMNKLSMHVLVHRLTTDRVRKAPPELRRYNISCAKGARGALVAMITHLFTEL